MNIIIKYSLKTLQKCQVLLGNLSNSQLCDTSVSPYYSCIGMHIRHILDFYDCIFTTDTEKRIDLTARTRNKNVESDCRCAQNYLNLIIERLNSSNLNINETVIVVDDLGLGETEILYTYESLLAQANSYTIHH